jgi:hypothetical protein
LPELVSHLRIEFRHSTLIHSTKQSPAKCTIGTYRPIKIVLY